MKTVIKLALTAALAAGISTSVSAKDKAEEQSFQRDGYTYVYSVSEKGESKQIRGKYFPGGRKFALEVRNGRVQGLMNATSVDFSLASVASSNGAFASAK